jgi:hypothetical protein
MSYLANSLPIFLPEVDWKYGIMAMQHSFFPTSVPSVWDGYLLTCNHFVKTCSLGVVFHHFVCPTLWWSSSSQVHLIKRPFPVMEDELCGEVTSISCGTVNHLTSSSSSRMHPWKCWVVLDIHVNTIFRWTLFRSSRNLCSSSSPWGQTTNMSFIYLHHWTSFCGVVLAGWPGAIFYRSRMLLHHYLVVTEVRDRLSVSKEKIQSLIWRDFISRSLQQLRSSTWSKSKTYAVLENSDNNTDMNRIWKRSEK